MRSIGRVCMLASALLVGCGTSGDDFPREAVSGSVTLDGEPLAEGNIQFLPSSDAQQTGATGQIRDGRFSIDRAAGPVPGEFKVSITADSGEQPEMLDGMPGGAGTPNADLIPEQYNVQSTLTAEVVKGGPNSYTFDLTSD